MISFILWEANRESRAEIIHIFFSWVLRLLGLSQVVHPGFEAYFSVIKLNPSAISLFVSLFMYIIA